MHPKVKVSTALTWTGYLPQGKNEVCPRGHLGGAEENLAADFFGVYLGHQILLTENVLLSRISGFISATNVNLIQKPRASQR